MPCHSERRVLPFTPQQLYNLVADIESYPEFLPWCIATRVWSTNDTDTSQASDGRLLESEMVVGYRALREKIITQVTLDPPHSIKVRYIKGALSRLSNEWLFAPARDGGCELSFHVDFAFKSSLVGAMMDVFFDIAFRKMVNAFEERAKKLYCTPIQQSPLQE